MCGAVEHPLSVQHMLKNAKSVLTPCTCGRLLDPARVSTCTVSIDSEWCPSNCTPLSIRPAPPGRRRSPPQPAALPAENNQPTNQPTKQTKKQRNKQHQQHQQHSRWWPSIQPHDSCLTNKWCERIRRVPSQTTKPTCRVSIGFVFPFQAKPRLEDGQLWNLHRSDTKVLWKLSVPGTETQRIKESSDQTQETVVLAGRIFGSFVFICLQMFRT